MIFRTYLLTPERVSQVFGVGKKPLRVIVFKRAAIIWESKQPSAGGELDPESPPTADL